MKRTAAICVALVFSLVSSVYAIYTVTDTGTWPKSWPAELEPLRTQSRTFEGPKQPLQHHAIPFTKRDEFESAWPHLLKIKSKGAPIVLKRGPSFWLGDKATAGVCVHTPPAGEAPIADGKDAKGNWEKTIYIELIVDGEIIDLNRIPLSADTPIIDERFKDVLIGEGAAANSGPAELPAAYPHWAGDWAVSSDLHRALGFGPDEHDRSSALSSSFQLSFDTQLNDSAKQYQSYFPKHQIVATGKWHDEKQDGFKNRDCVVTIHEGDTFLWVTGFPFIGVHGGKVSYLEGVNSEHDALVLDYNTMQIGRAHV